LQYVGCRDHPLVLSDDHLWQGHNGGLNVFGRLLMQLRDECLARGCIPLTPAPILLAPSPSTYAPQYIRVKDAVCLAKHQQLQVFDGHSYRSCREVLQHSRCVMPLSTHRFLLLNHTTIAGVDRSVVVYFDMKRDLMQVSRLPDSPSQHLPAVTGFIAVPVRSTSRTLTRPLS
jgi:hypothetical protein